MKRALITITLILVTAMVFLKIQPQDVPQEPTPHTSTKAVQVAKQPGNAPTIQQLVRSPRAPIPSLTAVQTRCLKFWETLRSDDVEARLNGSSSTLPSPDECTQVPQDLKLAHELYYHNCGKGFENSQGCISAILFYRIDATDFLTTKVPLDKITDPQILTDKLLSKIRKDPMNAVATAERLLEVEPHLDYAAKASLLGRLINLQGQSDGSADRADNLEGIDRVLRRVGEMSEGEVSEDTLKIRDYMEAIRSGASQEEAMKNGPLMVSFSVDLLAK